MSDRCPLGRSLNSAATAGSWVTLEKLPVAVRVKEFATFYGTRNLITVFSRALHLSISSAPSFFSHNNNKKKKKKKKKNRRMP
jgi:hypothetical protein